MDNMVLRTILDWLERWQDFLLLFAVGGLAIDLLGEFIKKPVLNHLKNKARKKMKKEGVLQNEIDNTVSQMKVNPLFGFITGAVLTFVGIFSLNASTGVPGGLPCIWLWYVLLLSYQAVAMPVGKAIMRKVFPGIVNPDGCNCKHGRPQKPKVRSMRVYMDENNNIVDKLGNPIIDDDIAEEADVSVTI